jgi:hypothetical protein
MEENNQNLGLNGNKSEANRIFRECENKIFQKADHSCRELFTFNDGSNYEIVGDIDIIQFKDFKVWEMK